MQKGGRAKVTPKPSLVVLAGVALVVWGLDQITKNLALKNLGDGRRVALVGDVLQFRLVRNPGSAFGFFGDSTLAIFFLTLGILAVVILWAIKSGRDVVSLGLVIGGGIGNLTDRVIQPPGRGSGAVVDFVYLSFWPTFNLADAAIVIGVGVLLLASFRGDRNGSGPKERSGEK